MKITYLVWRETESEKNKNKCVCFLKSSTSATNNVKITNNNLSAAVIIIVDIFLNDSVFKVEKKNYFQTYKILFWSIKIEKYLKIICCFTIY